jgi:hypothetical protein
MHHLAHRPLVGTASVRSRNSCLGSPLAARIDMKKARVAGARKLAVPLHHLWSHEEDFRWAPA